MAPTRAISVRLTENELERLDKMARARGTTRHDLMRQVVRVMVGLPTTADVLEAVKVWVDSE